MAHKHIFIAKQAKGLNFYLACGDKEVAVKFINGQFSTDDDELAKAIENAIATTAVGRFARKVDREAAEVLARKHAEHMRRTGAHKGGVTSIAMQEALNTEMQQRDAELRQQGGGELIDKFDQEENLVLTQAGVTSPSPGLQELAKGGDPTADLPVGEPVADAEPAEGERALATEEAKSATTALKFGA